MKLTVVGCSGSFPSAESACSSYLVEADGFRLLLDMGNGALGELQRHCGLYDLDAIFLSHLHADHCIDMCAYFVARYYRHDGGRCDPIPVYGPEGTEHRLTTAYADTPTASSMSEVFDFHTVKPSTFDIGPFTVHTERVRHPVEAYGIRVEHGGQVPDVLRRHGHQRRPGRTRPRHRPVPVRGRLHARQGEHPRPAPQRPRGGRDGDPAQAPAAWSSPTSPRGPTPRPTWPTPARCTTARWNWRRRGGRTRSDACAVRAARTKAPEPLSVPGPSSWP